MTCTKFSFGIPLTLKIGGKGSKTKQKIKSSTRTTGLFSLQFSQDEGFILLHSKYEKVKYYFTLKYTISVYSKIWHVFKKGYG